MKRGLLILALLATACTPSARGAGTAAPNTPSGFPTLAVPPTKRPQATEHGPLGTALPPGGTALPTVDVQSPIDLIGMGDSLVDVEKWEGPAVLHARYGGDSKFVVSSFNAAGQKIDVLVDTAGVYDGFRPLDFLGSEHTTRIEVKAEGAWHLELMPIQEVPNFEIPSRVQKSGDFVFSISGATPDTLRAENSARADFIVQGYSKNGRRDLLVNQRAPYTGTVLLPSDTAFIAVQAVGDWTIDIGAK